MRVRTYPKQSNVESAHLSHQPLYQQHHSALSEISVWTFNTGFACCVSTPPLYSLSVEDFVVLWPVKEHAFMFVNKLKKVSGPNHCPVLYGHFSLHWIWNGVQNWDETEREGRRNGKTCFSEPRCWFASRFRGFCATSKFEDSVIFVSSIQKPNIWTGI